MLLTALLNPIVVLVAFSMGRSASQWQKVPVAAFAAALAGWLVFYVVVWFGWTPAADIGWASAGVVVAQFFAGLMWATAGYQLQRRRP